MRLAQTGVP